MDELDKLIDRFNNKMETHPELSTVWVNYITIKKMRLMSMIQQGEKTLEMLETTNDIPIQSIALLYLMERYTNDNNA